MTTISSWTQGIVIAVIIATIIEMIVPDGNNKKYVKTILGIYILFTIMSPILSKYISMDDMLSEVYNYGTSIATDGNLDIEVIAVENDKYIESVYLSSLESDIKYRIKERGYYVTYFKVEIETENEKEYGKIKTLELSLKKMAERYYE